MNNTERLRNHLEKYPGEYRHWENADSAHNERWRAWAREKHRLQELVSIAEAVAPEVEFNPGLPRDKRAGYRDDRLTVEAYSQKFHETLAQLKTINPDDPKWLCVRGKAYNYRFRAIERAERDGIVLDLPTVPQRAYKRPKGGNHGNNR